MKRVWKEVLGTGTAVLVQESRYLPNLATYYLCTCTVPTYHLLSMEQVSHEAYGTVPKRATYQAQLQMLQLTIN